MEDPSNQEDNLSNLTTAENKGRARVHRKFYKPLRIIGLIIAVVFAVLIIFYMAGRPYDKTRNSYTNITVEEGEDVHTVASRLEENEIIGKAGTFETVAKLALSTDFKPGTYYLSPSMDSVSIARELCKGRVTLNGFVIPDGYTMDQTFTSLARDGFGDRNAFMEAAADPFLQELVFIGTDVDGSSQVEGFLMPGSYNLDIDADESMIIITMLDSFSNFFNDDYRARADELGLSIRDVVTIASMIEKETAIDSEKAKLSSVIHNRLNLGMIEPADFPDVPLCSPGEASIIAALYPDETEDTYYVLSSKLDGTHVFTSDEDEYKALSDEYEAALADRAARRAERYESGSNNKDDSEAAGQSDEDGCAAADGRSVEEDRN